MNIIDTYYYLLYKFYNLLQGHANADLQTKFKTTLTVCALELWLLFSVINYNDAFTGWSGGHSFFSAGIFIPFVVIILINPLAFLYKKQWKTSQLEFDAWPREKQDKGTKIVLALTVFIILDFVLSYILSHKAGGFRL